MPIADLHIHSRFSRATSREGDAPHLDLWARRKGIALVGTGDCTHPAWRDELRKMLKDAGGGLYRLKDEYRLADEAPVGETRFVLSCEISSIYKQDGKTRKVHNVFLLPSLDAADRFSARLEKIGNIRSDGRPILGLNSRDLLEIALEAHSDTVCIPAHIWTPHFSLFGAFSGFDRLEDCFGDLSGEIHVLETGLSSDPPMNRRVSALDKYTLVSNSDAHSPAKLGREANILAKISDYAALRRALHTGEGFEGTIEFFPEEGKYHLDGHRNCNVCLDPEDAIALDGKCPVCGKKLTIGVDHRVCELADRPSGFWPEGAKGFERLVPLPEVIGAALGVSGESKRAQEAYARLLRVLGDEFSILRSVPVADISVCAGELIAEGVRRVRSGEVRWQAGFDGEFGKCTIFTDSERRAFSGQTSLFAMNASLVSPKKQRKPTKAVDKSVDIPVEKAIHLENAEQNAAICARERVVAVIAGPGSGKTRTLVSRIEALIHEGVRPDEITAVTFTNQAASEMRERLRSVLGGEEAIKGMTIGTFHAIALQLLPKKTLISREESENLISNILRERGETMSPRAAMDLIAQNRAEFSDPHPLTKAYAEALDAQGLRDLDGLLLEALSAPVERPAMFRHLLVDEFQDINGVQRELVRHWTAKCDGLFVIGDPDQSIYGFRGASAACFDDLQKDYPDLRVIRLTKNYRSTPEICRAAADVICRNSGQKRQFDPILPSGAPVRLMRAGTAFDEAIAIAKEIARLAGGMDMIEAGQFGAAQASARAFSEIAVLCRTHRQLDLIEDCLRREDIPAIVHGRQSFLSDAKVASALAYFRNYTSKEPPRRLLEQWAGEHGSSAAFAKLLETSVLYETTPDMIEALLIGEEADVKRSCSLPKSSGAVRLMTLHGAKGLEFPIVFLAGLTQGAFPPKNYDEKDEKAFLEEERRLLFVGMTRAKEELILSCAKPESVFVEEVQPNAVCERVKPRTPQYQQLSLF